MPLYFESDTFKAVHACWDNNTIEYLKIVKDSSSSQNDWWDDLTESQKAGIERGLNDIRQGKTKSHEEVKNKYGL